MSQTRKKSRTLPSTSQASTTPVDLFLLAGLPNPLHEWGREYLQKLEGRYAKVIPASAPPHPGPFYHPSAVDTLLRAGAQFAIRRLKNRSEGQKIRPKRVALFYVPAQDDQLLLDAFDFFVFPIPMRNLAEFDGTGKQKRHSRDACEVAIRDALARYKEELIGIVQPRIESRKSSEPLLLPPNNFHLQTGRLGQVFKEISRGVRTWNNPIPEGIVAESFDRSRLPEFLDHQERQQIFQDSRKVVFPCARSHEFHGQQFTEGDARLEELRDFLRSTYRFGTSLPDGFHHDAQLEGGRRFQAFSFDCSRNGPISVTCGHANIYPNDYVRPGTS